MTKEILNEELLAAFIGTFIVVILLMHFIQKDLKDRGL